MSNYHVRKSIFLSFLFSLMTLVSFAQSYPLGYCINSIPVSGVGEEETSTVFELSAAIKLDAKKLAPVVGGEISAIKLAMIAEPNVPITTAEDLKVFIRSSLTGEDLYTQNVENFTKPGGWLEVELTTPFPINGEDIFVGYSLRANSIPLGFDNSKTPDERGSWVGVNGEWSSHPEFGNAYIFAMITSDKFVQRKVLLEHFTTGACVNCPPIHASLEKIVGDNENVIWVAHHSGYLSDPYTLPETEKYLWFFNAPSAYAPAIMLDRTSMAEYGAPNSTGQEYALGPVFAPVSDEMIEAFFPIRLNMPSILTVNIEESFNSANNELTITVSGRVAIPEFLGKNTTLNVFLTEDGLRGSQSGAGSNYTHNKVLRSTVSSVWGDVISFDAEGNYSKTYTKVLNSKWIPMNMEIIAFLSNYDAKNTNNCQVYNAASYKLRLDPSNIENVDDSKVVTVYAENSSIVIDGDFSFAGIYDTAGKLVRTMGREQSKCQINNGVYIVKVTNGDQIAVRKIVVNK